MLGIFRLSLETFIAEDLVVHRRFGWLYKKDTEFRFNLQNAILVAAGEVGLYPSILHESD